MLPRISADLEVGYGPLGAALAAGLIAYASGALAASRILSLLPSRGLLMGTYALTGGGLLVIAAAVSPATLAVGAIVTGFSAPLSWAATIHVAGSTTVAGRVGAVMASASGGAALGVLINGVLVRTSATVHTWRVSFVVAAAIALIPIVGAWLVYGPIRRPASTAGRINLRSVLGDKTGRLVVVTSSIAGIVGFPLATFLTATAIDEMRVSALAAASLWWLIGIFGMAGGPIIGGYGDRRTPLHALIALSLVYLSGLVVLVALWSYTGLIIAAVGFAVMNYPIWGVLGAALARDYEAAFALRAITLGLVGASLTGAVGNAATGAWIDSTGSFRGPVAMIALLMAGLVAWYVSVATRMPADLSRH